MDVVVFAIVLVALAAFVAAPLYRPALAKDEDRLDDAARHAAAVALDDLELDHDSGLVDQASYERERAALEQLVRPD